MTYFRRWQTRSAGTTTSPRGVGASLLSEAFPDRPTRYYHFYDKSRDEVIDGDLQRFVIEGGRLRFDEAVPVPSR